MPAFGWHGSGTFGVKSMLLSSPFRVRLSGHSTGAGMRIRDFRDLEVWQRSVDLAAEVYKVCRRFPREERYELSAQLRRAAISVSSNIAEGSGRATTKDFLNFLSHARGSLRETESILLVSQRLGFSTEAQLESVIDLTHRVGQMLTKLRASLKKRQSRKQRRGSANRGS